MGKKKETVKKVDKVKKIVVCDGVNITSKRGILSPGDEVKAHYVNCDLSDLVKRGHCKEI